LQLPLVGREIPVIADEYVDPEFGSGCVKITPAHDFNDYEVGKRHQLPVINILTRDAAINDNAPEKYRGMDRFEARKAVVADFEAVGLLDRIEKHKLKVPRGDRSNAVVEPYLTDQWYVDLTREVQPDGRPGGKQQITDPSINAVRNGTIRFVPENWDRTYFQWLENIQDWCISRQLWWGHRIPAWYDEAGNIYVADTEAAVREKYKLDDKLALRQDEDVLDTWFSSALWPFSTLGWPDDTSELKTFYPTSVLVTGFDIIFFWVARMIMFGMKFMDQQVPFSEVYIHGLVRDSNGQKMSKSKGNVLDPLDIIDGISLDKLLEKRAGNLMQTHLQEKIIAQTRREFPDGIPSFGTDALRFTFASLASTGRDVRFDLKRVEGNRNFCNKIWNASRFVLMNIEGHEKSILEAEKSFSLADRWIISKLNELSRVCATHIDNYRFDLAAQALYEFTWNEYCDWYLELCKPVLNSDAAEDLKNGARHTLANVFEQLLRLLHPLIPFITEELWQHFAPFAGNSGKTIMLQDFPLFDESLVDTEAVEEIEWVKQFVMGVRKIRSEMDIAPGKALPVLLENASAQDRERLQQHKLLLQATARLDSTRVLDAGETPAESATALIGELKLLIPLAGLIDKDAELARLERELNKLEGEIKRLSGKLGNEKFTSRAPQDVVAAERQKLQDAETASRQLSEQKAKIQAM
ncbi:MAG: valine--tRNA ligase, partial [Gammaproteobacteria bacterium]|nr:valine--tRNA ligase [Gammaproteobacteria bacterium]